MVRDGTWIGDGPFRSILPLLRLRLKEIGVDQALEIAIEQSGGVGAVAADIVTRGPDILTSEIQRQELGVMVDGMQPLNMSDVTAILEELREKGFSKFLLDVSDLIMSYCDGVDPERQAEKSRLWTACDLALRLLAKGKVLAATACATAAKTRVPRAKQIAMLACASASGTLVLLQTAADRICRRARDYDVHRITAPVFGER